MAQRSDNLVTYGLLAAGLFVAYKFAGLFGDEEPGGNVTPGQGDNRPATFDLATAGALADVIDVAFNGNGPILSPWENDKSAAGALMLCEVTNDVRLLMNAYGTRGQILSPLTLAQAVASLLDDDYRAAVNADYRAKGITITF